MPRQLASIMAEYAEHEESRKPTLFTRAPSGHVRAHEFNEPDDESAIRRIQGIVSDSAASVTGLLLLGHEPERVLITATDGATHIAAQALISEDDALREWEELIPGDEGATFMVNLLRRALGIDTLSQRKGALDEVAMIRRALDGFLQRVDADGYFAAGPDALEGDRLGLVELARDALDLATSHGRATKQLDEGVTLKRVPSPD
ncbi:hypothetical protein OJ998_01920 [Solirubrobacter taibaiensis]|nr:hypothetical protein [Solirubrobacter taibaiensis]